MKKDGYYSSGEFARMAHVTLRTVRYYDKQDILKPSLVTESGARFYTDEDFARLQHQHFLQDQSPQSVLPEQTGMVSLDL